MQKTPSAASVLLAALIVGAILAFLLKTLWVVIVVAAVGAVVALLVHKSSTTNVESPAASSPPPPDKPDVYGLLQQLLRLNLDIQENWPGELVANTLEHIIEQLRALVPPLNDSHPGSELTWVVNRMIEDYLPRTVRPFLKLDAVARASQQENLLTSLEGLQAELDEIENLVRGQSETDFRAKAAFLRTRFNMA